MLIDHLDDAGRPTQDDFRIERYADSSDTALRFGGSLRPERLRERRASLRRLRVSYPERAARAGAR